MRAMLASQLTVLLYSNICQMDKLVVHLLGTRYILDIAKAGESQSGHVNLSYTIEEERSGTDL